MWCIVPFFLRRGIWHGFKHLLSSSSVEARHLAWCLHGAVKLTVQEAEHGTNAAYVTESVVETNSEEPTCCTLLVDKLQAKQGFLPAVLQIVIRQAQIEEAALIIATRKLQVFGLWQATRRHAGGREGDSSVVQHDLPPPLGGAPVDLPQASGRCGESV